MSGRSQIKIKTQRLIDGHFQRGGSPTARDRVLASRMGAYAMDLLLQGEGGRCVGLLKNELVHHDIIDCIENMKRPFNEELYNLTEVLF